MGGLVGVLGSEEQSMSAARGEIAVGQSMISGYGVSFSIIGSRADFPTAKRAKWAGVLAYSAH